MSKSKILPLFFVSLSLFAQGNGIWNGNPGSGTGGGGLITYAALSVVLSGGTAPVFVPLGGDGLGSTTEANVQMKVQPVAALSNLCVNLSAAPGAGNSLVVTLRDGAADKAVTVTISNTATSACDTTHSFTNAAGDLMDWSLVPSGTIALFTPNVMISCQFGPGGGGGGGSSNNIGPIASLPVSVPAKGNSYYTTDGFYTFVSDGTAWQPFIGTINAVSPPTLTAAGSGGGTSTLDTSHGGLIFTMPAVNVGDSVKYAIKTAANSPPYTVVAAYYQPGAASTNNFAGIAFRESATQKAIALANRGINTINIIVVATDTSWSGGPTVNFYSSNSLTWVKAQNDGTTLKFFACGNPWNCNHLTALDQTIATRFTTAPNQVGVSVETEDAAQDASLSLVYFQETSGLN